MRVYPWRRIAAGKCKPRHKLLTSIGRIYFPVGLAAFNSNDRAQYLRFLQNNFPNRVSGLSQDMDFRANTGGFEFKKLEQASPTRASGLLQERDELSPVDLGKRFDGKEEVLGGMNPAQAVLGQDAGGNEAMDVEMIQQLLVPGVQHSQKAELAAEAVSRVAAELTQGLGYGLEQDSQDYRLVAQDERIEDMGQGEE